VESLDHACIQGFLKTFSLHPKQVLCQEVKDMQTGLLLELIGGGAVVSAMVTALALGLVLQQLLREMKRLAD
jgi:hypothetical protein